MRTRLLIACSVACLVACSDAKQEDPIEKRYVGDWQSGDSTEISRALAKNEVRDCDEYQFKPSAIDGDEYLVRCARDDNEMRSYVVWTRVNRIRGPLPVGAGSR